MPTRRRISANVGRSTVVPADAHGAAGRRVDAVEGEDQRRLAGAVGAEDGDPLACRDREIDAPQGLVPVGIGERKVAHLERGRRHACTDQATRATSVAAAGHARQVNHAQGVAAGLRTGSEPT